MKPKLVICVTLCILVLPAVSPTDNSPNSRLDETTGNSIEGSSKSFMSRVNNGLKPILGALEGVDSWLRSTRNFDVFQCLERFSCEMTAPLRNLQQGDRPFSLKAIEDASLKFNQNFDRSALHDEGGHAAVAAVDHGNIAATHSLSGQQFLNPQVPQFAPQHALNFAQPGLPGVQQGIQYAQQFAQPAPQPPGVYQPQYFYPGSAFPAGYPQVSPYIHQQVAQAPAVQQYAAHQTPLHPTQAFGHNGHLIYPQPNPYGFPQGQPQHYAPPAVKRSDTGNERGRASSSSWFSGYRNRILNRQINRNRFRRPNGFRQKRSTSNEEPWLETKSRARRGIFDVITKAISGKEVVGVLDRMMQDTDDSLYPYTRAALMGYMGSHQTCEQLYPQCPTTTDELIDTFNNLRSFFPNGIPFRDRLPPPLRFLLP